MSGKLVFDNLYALIFGKKAIGKVNLNNLSNLALFRTARDMAFENAGSLPKLSKEQKKELKKLWSPYFVFVPTKYHRLYLKCTGEFKAEYIPEDIMFMYIDRFYSDRKSAQYIDNKCYYCEVFKGINMPKLVAMKMANQWFDSDMKPVDYLNIPEIIRKESEVVIKKATDSECGMGVTICKGDAVDASFIEKINKDNGDYVIQEVIKQHPFMGKLNEDSVNTIRIISLIKDGEVKIVFSGVLRFGAKGSRVDNVSSGGSAVYIDSSGRFDGKAVYKGFERCQSIPGYGSEFAGLMVPGYEDAVQLVKKAHVMVSDYRLMHWDIAVDENGRAVLVEANFSLGSALYFQNVGQPLFGDLTEDVLREVFGRKRRLSVLG